MFVNDKIEQVRSILASNKDLQDQFAGELNRITEIESRYCYAESFFTIDPSVHEEIEDILNMVLQASFNTLNILNIKTSKHMETIEENDEHDTDEQNDNIHNISISPQDDITESDETINDVVSLNAKQIEVLSAILMLDNSGLFHKVAETYGLLENEIEILWWKMYVHHKLEKLLQTPHRYIHVPEEYAYLQ
jgi:hypothetical protein